MSIPPAKSLILYTITITLLFGTAGLPITAAILITTCWYYTRREPLDKKTWKRIGNICILLILILIPATVYYAITYKPTCWIILDGIRYDADCELISQINITHADAHPPLSSQNGSPYYIRLNPTSPTSTHPGKPPTQTP